MTDASSTPALAIVVKGYPRLSETFVAREFEALERRGLRFSLHALRNPSADAALTKYNLTAQCQYLPEYLHTAPMEVLAGIARAVIRPGFALALLQFFSDFRREPTRARIRRFGQACVLASQLGSDVRHIHCHFAHSPGSVTRYAARLLNITYSLSTHAKDVWTDPEWDLRSKLEGATFVVACNRSALERLSKLMSREKLSICYHGVDANLILSKVPVQVRDGSNKEAPVRLIAVARAVEKKGLSQLLASLSLLPPDVAYQLHHYGDGPLLSTLQRMAQDLGIARNVTFHGAQSHSTIIAGLDSSDLFVFPASVGADGDRDGIPNALLEANARGICVVACESGGTAEAVSNGVTGLIVSDATPASLAQKLLTCIRNPNLRQQLAATALRMNAALLDAQPGYDALSEALHTRMST